MDFCLCHLPWREAGKRVRLQDLPDLRSNPGDGVGFAAWPAYRVSSGELWTLQRRLNDCFRQQRFPYPGYASDLTIALGVFMGVNAQGAEAASCPRSSADAGSMHLLPVSATPPLCDEASLPNGPCP